MATEKTIFVYMDQSGEAPVLMGRLFVAQNRRKESFSFSFSDEWLSRQEADYTFDPDLFPYAGRQYVSSDKTLFGLFEDSCPDRWGRLLMRRREALVARSEDRKPRALLESDYLLGVYDKTRMGALRFSLDEGGDFVSSDTGLAAPPWTSLRTLESASFAFENEEDPNEEKWLRQLLAPGSSLGGARPKASVVAPDGSLWIAKFPSRNDEWNTGAWEAVTHDLAGLCGLDVPAAKAQSFSKNGSTFLVKRFDRDGSRRVHFESAMTLLGKTDGADDVSYLDIADFIRAHGACPERDLRELWSRVVFNIAVSNTDDHLRNHGFLLTQDGWRLSPAYDVNPNIYGSALSLAISREDGSLDFELALETAEEYGLSLDEAKSRVSEIKDTVDKNWQSLASQYGLGREAIQRMSPAFDMAYKKGSKGYSLESVCKTARKAKDSQSLDDSSRSVGARDEI